jgi:hypothetical protein
MGGSGVYATLRGCNPSNPIRGYCAHRQAVWQGTSVERSLARGQESAVSTQSEWVWTRSDVRPVLVNWSESTFRVRADP